MLALTILEPWCHAITHGSKRVENRTWMPPASLTGQTIALHASKRFDWDAQFPAGHTIEWCAPEDLTLGAVTGVAQIAGCHPRCHICNPSGIPETVCTPWSQWGQCHWLLSAVRPLAEPVLCRGAQRLWTLPVHVEKAVREQLESTGESSTDETESGK